MYFTLFLNVTQKRAQTSWVAQVSVALSHGSWGTESSMIKIMSWSNEETAKFHYGNAYNSVNADIILDICHFFYKGRIFYSKFYTTKYPKSTPLITKNTPLITRYASFYAQYNVLATNIRYTQVDTGMWLVWPSRHIIQQKAFPCSHWVFICFSADLM